MYKKSTK